MSITTNLQLKMTNQSPTDCSTNHLQMKKEKKEKRNLSKKRKHDTKARHSSQALVSSIILLLLGPSGS